MNENGCCKKTSIGGQALLEGIMMRGPERTAMAVRDPAGEIVLEAWDTGKTFGGKLAGIPVVRGIFNFISSMKLGYKCLMRSAEIALPEEEAEKEKKKDGKGGAFSGLLGVTTLLIALVFSVAVFIYLPSLLFGLLAKAAPALDNRIWRSVFEGLLRIALFLVYLGLTRLSKDIHRTFMYHGAEHKTIFCYEHGRELTVENIREESRFHPRCGTSFLILMLLVGIFVSIFIPIKIAWLRTLVKLALLPLVMGIGYELIKFAGRHDNLFTRIISAPGMWVQRLTTIEPEDDMIECAIRAFEAVVPEDGKDDW